MDAAYALADRSLARIVETLSPGDAIFVTSDHGMAPLRTTVYPDEILRRAGLLRVTRDGKIDPASPAVAITSSGVANVYLNPATATPGTLDAVQKALSEFRVDGESPWDRLVRRADAGPLGLDAPGVGRPDLRSRARDLPVDGCDGRAGRPGPLRTTADTATATSSPLSTRRFSRPDPGSPGSAWRSFRPGGSPPGSAAPSASLPPRNASP